MINIPLRVSIDKSFKLMERNLCLNMRLMGRKRSAKKIIEQYARVGYRLSPRLKPAK